jgi:hypothetical protein
MLRVRWKLFGSLQSSIEVADDLEAGPSSSLSPYQQTNTGGISFHQISKSPATEPLVSSIIVKVVELEYWGSDWEDGHAEDESEDQVWVDDDTNFDNGEPLRILMRCCGEDRPQAPPPLLVEHTSQSFVTVHDYITQVHTWFQNLQTDIERYHREHFIRGPPSFLLYVFIVALDSLSFIQNADHHWKHVAEHARRRREGTLPPAGTSVHGQAQLTQ